MRGRNVRPASLRELCGQKRGGRKPGEAHPLHCRNIIDAYTKEGYNRYMELLTVHEAAAQKNVSPTAIYYALTAGNMTKHKKFGRVLVDAAELENYQPKTSGRLEVPDPEEGDTKK